MKKSIDKLVEVRLVTVRRSLNRYSGPMSSSAQDFRDRSKRFAIRTIRLYRALPTRSDAQLIGKQLFRSATSVAANHRAACRARSKAEFTAKLGVVVEEVDESLFWLELLGECCVVPQVKLEDLIDEAKQLTAMFTAAYHTSKAATRKDWV
ncbi:MAG TPA: four helix bundle protein [Terriglobales bacterium]|nr:four helix bundle protein [Terriglobales bacterium]